MNSPTSARPPSDSGPSTEPAASTPDPWQSTREQTQLACDEHEYLEAEQKDVGRPVGKHQRELFVSCDAAQAMEQQFEHLQPEFIAIHDIGTQSSRQLIAGIAAASKGAVQRLLIRRQGYGTTIATLEFVELPTAEGGMLRIYTTEVDADTTTRHAMARTLLAFSTLGVIMVGDLPGHSMSGIFKPLHERMLSGPWPNRHLLMLPLSTANALVTQGMELARGTGVTVRTTPQVTRPADAWNFVSGTWGRLRAELRGAGTPASPRSRPAPAAERPTPPPPAPQPPMRTPSPLPLRPMPEVTSKAAGASTGASLLSRYVAQLSELTGMVSCCVFDVSTGRDIAHAGASPGAGALAKHGADLMAAMLGASRSLGLGHALPDAAVTLGAHHLVLRPVPKHPGLALHAVLDKTHANLTLARLQIARMDALFEAKAPGA